MLNRRDFHRRTVGLGAAAGAGWLIGTGGCSSEQPAANSVKPSAGSQTSGGQSPAAGVTIGMIAKSQSNPVFLAARRGAEARAAELTEELGAPIAIDWRTPNDEDAQKQAEFIEQLVSAGVDALTIACSDASKVTRALDDAIAKGVVAMCFDSDAPESKRLCYVGTDDFDAGSQILAEVAKLLGDKEGVVAVLAGNQTATNLQKRVRGVQEQLKKHPSLKLHEVYYHKETPQDAYATVESVQKANPEINAWAMVGGWPLMTDRALPWTPGEVVCVSMDTLPAELKHVRDGDVQLLLGQRYFYFGGKCVDILVNKVRDGKDPEQPVEFAPLDRVTKENVDEYAKNWEKWA